MADVFSGVQQQIGVLAAGAMRFLLFLIVVVVTVGGLYGVLHGALGTTIGSQRSVTYAVLTFVGLVVMALLAFLLVPALGDVLAGMASGVLNNPPWHRLG